MADHYEQFSEMIEELSLEAQHWARYVLSLDGDEDRGELYKELGITNDDFDVDCWPSFGHELKDDNLWLFSEDSCNTNHVAFFVQALIKKFMPEYIFSLSSAGTCSKLRVGEFGGGWMVVTRDEIKGGNVWDAIEDAVAEIKEARK
jgi:hypothetical protein